ncbi:MAG TPA: hypothetical protein VFH70_07730 [Acidimicrobiales bacterium]|nr:hypothetical protein [Acidimicrobiales bacterium]
MSAPTTKAAPQTEITAEELFEDLTGFDEIAIGRAFGEDIAKLRKQPFMFIRALVFIDQRRRLGLKDKAAHEAAMRLRVADLNTYFDSDDEPEEVTPDEPVTARGKDES